MESARKEPTVASATGQQVEVIPRGAVVNADAGSILAVISRAASDPNTDVDKLERLMGMYERINAHNAKAAYAAALARMQRVLPIIGERGEITVEKRVRSTYAKWDDINEAIRPILADHGFSLSFRTGREADQIIVTGVLAHEQGHSEETTMRLPLDTSGSKNNVQAVGSSISYGQRYTAKALLNLTSRHSDDDDGHAAGAGETITDEQAEAIRSRLQRASADIRKFCEYLKVQSIPDIPASKFDAAIRAVQVKEKLTGGAQ